uniref:GTP-binding protein Rheb isoform 2 n=1 Tax=Peranema trichophorum TaxID=56466 RepID=A0A2R4IKW4_9EUGL|nr:GTP-binding protein Rheb isoform 2 [Peranema trichophorum]
MGICWCCFKRAQYDPLPSLNIKPQRKVVMLGCSAVGKTALTQQFVNQRFPTIYHPTVDQTWTRVIQVRGVEVELIVLDTCGQDELELFHSRYYIGTHGFILVYAIDDVSSFAMMETVYQRVCDNVLYPTIVLVGNKSDRQSHRKVTREQGQALANRWGCPFIESCAQQNESANVVFGAILDIILEREDSPTPTSGTSSSFLHKIMGT